MDKVNDIYGIVPRSAQFVDTYYPTIDGVVNTVNNYARILNRESYSCVMCPEQNKNFVDRFSYDVIRVKSIRLPIREYRAPMTITNKSCENLINDKKIEILHAHSPFQMGKYGARMRKKFDIPLVATFHSKYYDDALSITKSSAIADEVVRQIVRFYNTCDQVWAVSHGTADTLHAYGYKKDIFVMDNGTDFVYPKNDEELKQKARKEFDVPDNVPILLFVGHQIWQKNIKLMLDAVKDMKTKGENPLLLVVGSGYAAHEIKKYADNLGVVPDNVRFISQVSDKGMLKGLYMLADLFVFLSVYDNSPLVVREAAAMRLPSLLTAGTNAAEVVNDGENGFLCSGDASEVADKIIELIKSPELLKTAGVNASKTIGRNWEEIIPAVARQYRKIVG